jgi:hypothetical protein
VLPATVTVVSASMSLCGVINGKGREFEWGGVAFEYLVRIWNSPAYGRQILVPGSMALVLQVQRNQWCDRFPRGNGWSRRLHRVPCRGSRPL